MKEEFFLEITQMFKTALHMAEPAEKEEKEESKA